MTDKIFFNKIKSYKKITKVKVWCKNLNFRINLKLFIQFQFSLFSPKLSIIKKFTKIFWKQPQNYLLNIFHQNIYRQEREDENLINYIIRQECVREKLIKTFLKATYFGFSTSNRENSQTESAWTFSSLQTPNTHVIALNFFR
jgi:hypothetical protein